MPFDLPSLSLEEFRHGLEGLSPEPLPKSAFAALHAHYLELSRWNRKLSLIGPGTASEVLSRHYGESLAALPLLHPEARDLVDLGSGAGFPGLVLAAARPQVRVTLVEARERKWSFLLAAARRASLPCRCLNVRVAVPLAAGFPEAFDLVTVRALKLDRPVLAALAGRLRPSGKILLWTGEREPELPPELAVAGERRLAGSERRRILELELQAVPESPSGPGSDESPP